MILIDIGAVLVLACVVVIILAAIVSGQGTSAWEDIKLSLTIIGVALLVVAASVLVGLSIEHLAGLL
jgi:hypothetical protein